MSIVGPVNRVGIQANRITRSKVPQGTCRCQTLPSAVSLRLAGTIQPALAPFVTTARSARIERDVFLIRVASGQAAHPIRLRPSL